MTTNLYQSSDSVRSAKPLRHVQQFHPAGALELERGGRLEQVVAAYETYGRLNAAGDNAVLICHALSGDSHVAAHDAGDDPGWWDAVVGPGKAIDTDRYFVICPNVLGGCRGTTGPGSVNPATGRPYGPKFPVITVGDIVELQRRLVDHLGVARLRAVVGGSLGGHMVLTWATRWPGRVAGAAALATSARLTSQALAFDIVGRNAILRDPAYAARAGGDLAARPEVGLAIARMLGHITYLSREAMTSKFDRERFAAWTIETGFETKFAVGSYLAHQGDKFVERFDADSYLALSMAMDLFDLGGSPAELRASLAPAACRWLLISYSTDWLFPPFQSRELVDALIALGKPVSYCNVTSNCGHDAFLLEDDLAVYGCLLSGFLENLTAAPPLPHPGAGEGRGEGVLPPLPSQGEGRGEGVLPPLPPGEGGGEGVLPQKSLSPLDDPTADADPTSIYHGHRLDYDSMLELIAPDASVLDLGCGSGGLLARMRGRGQKRVMGIELDEQAIAACVQRGLDVVHGDLDRGLPAFAAGQFDVVVLSQTLQTVRNVELVIKEMLRVGRRGIVSFPNLAYHKLRETLARDGRAPRATALQGFNWYDTPNVRFLSIADFEDFCRSNRITIQNLIALDTEAGRPVTDDPNRNADLAIVVITR